VGRHIAIVIREAQLAQGVQLASLRELQECSHIQCKDGRESMLSKSDTYLMMLPNTAAIPALHMMAPVVMLSIATILSALLAMVIDP
jgi:hypothetical protein